MHGKAYAMKKFNSYLVLILILPNLILYADLLSAQDKTITVTRKVEGDTEHQIWNRIMHLFSMHDIPIETIDRSGGYILSGAMSFTNAFATEVAPSKGDCAAYVVAQGDTIGGIAFPPYYITGQLKIFILPDENFTECRVSIEHLKNYRLLPQHYPHSSLITYKEIDYPVHSTGLLENLLADFIIAKSDTIYLKLINGIVINQNENLKEASKKLNRKHTIQAVVGSLSGVAALAGVITIIAKTLPPPTNYP